LDFLSRGELGDLGRQDQASGPLCAFVNKKKRRSRGKSKKEGPTGCTNEKAENRGSNENNSSYVERHRTQGKKNTKGERLFGKRQGQSSVRENLLEFGLDKVAMMALRSSSRIGEGDPSTAKGV